MAIKHFLSNLSFSTTSVRTNEIMLKLQFILMRSCQHLCKVDTDLNKVQQSSNLIAVYTIAQKLYQIRTLHKILHMQA
jgi:hypothetical protein